MSDAFEIFSVPGQLAGLDGHVGNADFSLNIADWSEENENDQYMPAEEFDLTPGDAVQHRAQDGDGVQVGIRNFLDLDADALTALTAVTRVPRPPVHAVRQDGDNLPRDRVREPVREQQPGVVRETISKPSCCRLRSSPSTPRLKRLCFVTSVRCSKRRTPNFRRTRRQSTSVRRRRSIPLRGWMRVLRR